MMLLLFIAQTECARGLAFVQVRQQAFQQRDQLLRILVARLGLLAVALDGAFHHGQVGQCQFGQDDFDVGNRIDLAGDVHHVGIVKTAHHVDDGIGLADVGQELVAQTFAFGRARHQPGDVDELDDRRLHALRLDDLRQLFHARIGHLDDADVRFDGAERIVLRGDARLGQRIEQGGFADIGQSDDTAFQTHCCSLIYIGFKKARIVSSLVGRTCLPTKLSIKQFQQITGFLDMLLKLPTRKNRDVQATFDQRHDTQILCIPELGSSTQYSD